MRFGLSLPIFDDLADPNVVAALAEEAEQAGWDGVFVWDHVYYRAPVRAVADPWITLAAIAVRTSSVLLGPLVTPIARRRPHVLARQIASLDLLAPGRTIFGAGLGLDGSGGEFSRFGEPLELRQRGEAYDEGLDLLGQLLTGDRVDFTGAHHTASDVTFLPRPARRVPTWIAARWPHRRPWSRAARHDGVAIISAGPDDVAEVHRAVRELRGGAMEGFDVVVQTTDWTTTERWESAGATWLVPTIDPFSVTPDAVREVISARAGIRWPERQ